MLASATATTGAIVLSTPFAVTVNQMQANGTGGSVTIAATNLVVGPVATPTPLLKTSGVANLTSVTGVVSLENGGLIVAGGGITLKPNGAYQLGCQYKSDRPRVAERGHHCGERHRNEGYDFAAE